MRKHNSKILYVTFFILTSIVLGCSSLPSENDAKNDLKKLIEEQSKGNIELLKFEKTNALKQNVFGFEEYTIEVKIQIKLNEEGFLKYNALEGELDGFNLYPKRHHGFSKFFDKSTLMNLKGKVEYEKTEKGYRRTRWSKFIEVEQ